MYSKKSLSTESMQDSRPDTGPTFRDPNLAINSVPISSLSGTEYFQPLKKSDRESTEESAKKSVKSPYDGEYDLASSNKKMRMQAEEIEKMSEKITQGF